MTTTLHPKKIMHSNRSLFNSSAIVVALFALGSAFAQVTPAFNPPTARPESKEEAIVLSPFEVTADSDKGYQAGDTLAGTRFKTELKDTAASISVLTADFLSDVGANDLTDALKYSASAQLNVGDDSGSSASPNGNTQQSSPPLFRVRGQATTQARNYFTLSLDTNTYNIERIEDSRGPNSVLFGFGSPGGILNISTKQPRTDRSFNKATVETGSFDSHRETLDINRVLMQGKLAVRVNAVDDQMGTFQEYAFKRDRRFDLGVKYQVMPTLQLRVEFERAFVRENKPRPFALLDGGVQSWLAKGAPTTATLATNAALGITRISTSSRRLTWVGNTNTLVEMAGSLQTTDPGTTAITNRALAGPTINYAGPGEINQYNANNFSVFLEKKIGRSTFVELVYHQQNRGGTDTDPSQTNLKLWGDPNQFLPVGTTNPYAGKMYIENSSAAWERNITYTSLNALRATISTEADAGKWGNYRVAALAEYDRNGSRTFTQQETWAGAPFNAAPENAVNQVRRRNYVTPGVWNTFYINSPLTTGLIKGAIDPVTGRTLNSAWIARGQNNGDSPSNQKIALVSGQARYFGGRIVLGAGFRDDKVDSLVRTAQRDPVTQEYSAAYATEVDTPREAKNSTVGVMVHLMPAISVFYNRANNQGLPPSQKIIDITNLNAPAITGPLSKGEGQDYGFNLRLLDGKINLRAARYTTNTTDLTMSFSPTGIGPDKVSSTIMGTLQAAGLVTQAVADAHTTLAAGATYTLASKGYEVSLIANPTKNWRMQVNYSYTDTAQSNWGPELFAWANHEIAYWQSFNRGSLQTNSTTTIDQAIAFMLAGFNTQANIGGLGETGVRPSKVNVFTRYDLPWETLKGAYVGGGYRFQSKDLAGSNATNTVGYYGPSFWRADLLAGYKFQKSVFGRFGQFVKGLTIQLNVDNVFGQDKYLITRIQPDGVTVWRAIPQAPRSWRLQAMFDF